MLLVSLLKPQKDGSLPISKFFRKIFESKNIRLFLGINLALFSVLIGCFETPSAAFTQEEAILVRPKDNIIHTENTFEQPVSGYISQGYHWYHPAIDIVACLKQPIYPIAEGKVKEVDYSNWGYGHKIVIEHNENLWSLYAHLGKIKVKPNQKVDKNTVIGTIGLTGWTSGPHLHLEIWKDNQPINPITVLPDFKFQLASHSHSSTRH